MQSVVEFAWWCFLYPILNLPSMSCTLPLIGPVFRLSISANSDLVFPLLKIVGTHVELHVNTKLTGGVGWSNLSCFLPSTSAVLFAPPLTSDVIVQISRWVSHHCYHLISVWLHLCCVSVNSLQMVLIVRMKTAGRPLVARPPSLVCVQHASLSSSVKQAWCKVCERVCVLVCVGAARVCLDVRSVRSQVLRLQPFNIFHFGFWSLVSVENCDEKK